MKKKILPLGVFALFISTSLVAQFSNGDKVLGFGMGFNTNSTEQTSSSFNQTTKSNLFNLSTELGFANGEHSLKGFFINGGFGRQKFENTSQPGSNYKEDNYNVGGGFFTRRYKPLGKSFFVFADGRLGFNYGEKKVGSTSSNNEKNYNASAGIYPGVAYKWNQKFLLELRFADLISTGYTRIQTKNGVNNAKSTSSSFGIYSSLGLGYLQNFGIGARWIIGQKKSS